MTPQVAALIAAEQLPTDYATIVDRWWHPLAARIAQWHKAAGRALLIGVNGAQGSGKSTLCRFLEHALLPEFGLNAVTVSLDDLYLTRAERADLGRRVHPLLATRGVPGTHDVSLGQTVFDDLLAGRSALVPRFSKALDDRLPREQALHVQTRADVILFEGWCVGAAPQRPADLVMPINALEAEHDQDGIWRKFVNDRLAGPYADLFGLIDHLVVLQAPSFASVLQNRLKQEHKLRAIAPVATRTMNDAEVEQFIMHYERLTRNMMESDGVQADIRFDLNDTQQVIRCRSDSGQF